MKYTIIEVSKEAKEFEVEAADEEAAENIFLQDETKAKFIGAISRIEELQVYEKEVKT